MSNKMIKLKGVESEYSELEIEYMLDQPRASLTPAEFLFIFKYEQKQKGFESGRKQLTEDQDLYDIFETNEKSRKSPNQLVKAIRVAGLKCSNERSKIIFPIFTEQYKGEQDEI